MDEETVVKHKWYVSSQYVVNLSNVVSINIDNKHLVFAYVSGKTEKYLFNSNEDVQSDLDLLKKFLDE